MADSYGEMTSCEGLCKELSDVWCSHWLLYCITYLCSKAYLHLLFREIADTGYDVMFYCFSPFPLAKWISFTEVYLCSKTKGRYLPRLHWDSFLDKKVINNNVYIVKSCFTNVVGETWQDPLRSVQQEIPSVLRIKWDAGYLNVCHTWKCRLWFTLSNRLPDD